MAWGIAGWSVFAAQRMRLIELAGLKAAPVALSLNASFLYLGFSIGAALGGATLARATAGDLGWVAAVAELSALAPAATTLRLWAMRPGEVGVSS